MMTPRKTGKKVLLTEDNRDFAEVTTLLLESEGHEVRAAYDGLGAVETLRDFAPDVAIIDLGLPGMDGYEVARRLHDLMPDLALIALTGWSAELGKTRASEVGFVRYLVKPVDPAELSRLLAEL